MKRINGYKEACKLLDRRCAGSEYILSTRLKQSLKAMFGVETAEEAVGIIIDEVRSGGDKALLELGEKIDRVELEQLQVFDCEIREAVSRVRPDVYKALEKAAARIKEFHDAQREAQATELKLMVVIRLPFRLDGWEFMLPAYCQLSIIGADDRHSAQDVPGVNEVILATPPVKTGRFRIITLAAASIAGVDRVFLLAAPRLLPHWHTEPKLCRRLIKSAVPETCL
jgi:histidinol dehydrogenase